MCVCVCVCVYIGFEKGKRKQQRHIQDVSTCQPGTTRDYIIDYLISLSLRKTAYEFFPARRPSGGYKPTALPLSLGQAFELMSGYCQLCASCIVNTSATHRTRDTR